MEFIEEAKAKEEREHLTLNIEAKNKRMLEAYSKFKNSDNIAWTLDKILARVWGIDEKFKVWLAEHPEALQKGRKKSAKAKPAEKQVTLQAVGAR